MVAPTWMIIVYIVSFIIGAVIAGMTISKYRNKPEWKKDSEDIKYMIYFCLLIIMPGINTFILLVFAGLYVSEEWL